MLLPEYGKQKLLTYADSFKELADVFKKFNEDREENKPVVTKGGRSDYLYQRKVHENREIMAEHLNEMAQIMTEVAKVSFAYAPIPEQKSKKVFHALRQEGILLKEIHYIESVSGRMEIGASMASEKGKTRTGEEVADMLSVLYAYRYKNRRYIPVLVMGASLMCYMPFLTRQRPIDERWLALMMLGALVIVSGDLLKKMRINRAMLKGGAAL